MSATYVENAMFNTTEDNNSDSTFDPQAYARRMHAHTLRQLSLAKDSPPRRSSDSSASPVSLSSQSSADSNESPSA